VHNAEGAVVRRSIWLVGLAVLLGVPAGVGAFTFIYAKGFSYLSTDPRACVNCHVMNEQYDGWLKSGHRHTATCVDCHLPAHGLAKWVAKADHGFRHSTAFTLQNFKEPIEITPHDLELVQENCLRCHATVVHAVAVGAGPHGERLDCMHCHAGAGHGAGG
jgi:cytochrome c nitrite reductase small subunit